MSFKIKSNRGWMTVYAICLVVSAGPQSRLAAQPAPETSIPQAIVTAFDAMFHGPHPAARAVHANGIVLSGDFVPTPEAAEVSRALHLHGGAVPVIVRFSNFAAIPGLPDGSSEASPRGMAIKFMLPDGGDTDIVAHSYNGFPAATPAGFLSFLQAVPNRDRLASLDASQPAVHAFLADPKPAPVSYATEQFFGVTAFRFTNSADTSRFGRYRMVPLAGAQHFTVAQAAGQPPTYLQDELSTRLASGPVRFQLLLQMAEDGDDVTDGSTPWPSDRTLISLGTLTLHSLTMSDPEKQRDLRFVPTNLVSGISPSKDPMLLARTQAYRISAERRSTGE